MFFRFPIETEAREALDLSVGLTARIGLQRTGGVRGLVYRRTCSVTLPAASWLDVA